MSDSRKVHDFLDAGFTQESKARLATGHDVALITKDRHSIRRQCPGSYVEDTRQEFAGDFIHIRNHEQKAL